MPRWILCLGLAVAFLLFHITPSFSGSGTTRYVALGGSGGSNCSAGTNPNTPMNNFAAAINCSGSSDTVVLRGGTYFGRFENRNTNSVRWPTGGSDWTNNFFTVTAWPGETVWIQGIVDQYIMNADGSTPSYLLWDRVNITAGSAGDNPTAVGEVAAYFGAAHTIVKNSEICCANSQLIEGGEGGDLQLLNNHFHHANIWLDRTGWQRCGGQTYPPPGIPCSVGGYCFYGHGKNMLFDGNIWHDCTGIAIHWYHGNPPSSDPLEISGGVIRNNIFYNNSTTDGDRHTGISVLILYTGQNNTVYNNIFYNNGQGYDNIAAVIQTQDHNDLYANNTFFNNGQAYAIYPYPNSSQDIKIYNNIVSQHTGVILNNGLRTDCSNTVSDNPNLGMPCPNSRAPVNPAFVNAGGADFHLQAGSPAIDAGINLGTALATDFAGTPRGIGQGWDIGAYEFGGSGTSVPTKLRFTTQPQNTPAGQTLPTVVAQGEDNNGNLVNSFTSNVTVSLLTGQPTIPQTGWQVKYVDSVEPTGNWAAANVFDGNSSTAWHTQFSGTPPGLPHEIQIDLGAVYPVAGFKYLPRQGSDHSGQITGWAFYTSTDCTNWGTPAATGTFPNNSQAEQTVTFAARSARGIRFVATNSVDGTYASAAEINVLQGGGTGSGTLSGTLTKPASGGVVTFDDLKVSSAGTYQLQAASSGLANAVSSAFTVTNAATQLVWGTQPSTILVNQSLPPLTVSFLDASGTVFSTSQSVHVGIASGTATVPTLTFVSVDSANTQGLSTPGTNAIDGSPSTFWATDYSIANPPPPHQITVNLGASYPVNGIRYLPRQDGGLQGTIANYEVYVSTDGLTWGTAVATGTWAYTAVEKVVTFPQKTGQYVKLVAVSEGGGNPWTTVAELSVQYNPTVSGPGTLVGTVDVNAVGGVATFAGLKLSAPGAYQLAATATGVTGATSQNFAVLATPAIGREWAAAGTSPRLCATVGSNANVSTAGAGTDFIHDFACQIDANRLRNLSAVQSCVLGALTTSNPPVAYLLKLRAANTILAAPPSGIAPQANLIGRTAWTCWRTMVNGSPGATTPTYTNPLGTLTGWMNAAVRANSIPQPVTLPTNGVLSWTISSQWASAGSGSASVFVPLAFVVRSTQ